MPGTSPPVADERSGLLAYLAQQRDALCVAAHGLTDDQARLALTAGSLSVGGLIKHLAATERGWIDIVLQRQSGSGDDAVDGYELSFQLLPDETLAEVLATYEAVAAETEAVMAGIDDLGQAVPVPKGVPWYPQDLDAWSVRWVLLHLIEETARHAGHADIVRESIDGATFYPLMAAAEGWPPSPWMQPWQPRTRAVSSFVIDSWDQFGYDEAPGSELAKTRVTKTFSGDLVGTSTAELLMVAAAGGAMAYVGQERITVELEGRAGSFILRHCAYGDASGGTGSWTILEGSGTDGLEGITGRADIDRHDDGSHTFTLDYSLA